MTSFSSGWAAGPTVLYIAGRCGLGKVSTKSLGRKESKVAQPDSHGLRADSVSPSQ